MDAMKKAAKLAALKMFKDGLREDMDEDAIDALGVKEKPHKTDFEEQEGKFWDEARDSDPEKAKVAVGFLATKYSDLGDMLEDFDEDRVVDILKNSKKPMVIADESADGGVGDIKILKSEPKSIDTSKLSKDARKAMETLKKATEGIDKMGSDFMGDVKKGADNVKRDAVKAKQKVDEKLKGIEDLLDKDSRMLTPEDVKRLQEFLKMQRGSPDAGE